MRKGSLICAPPCGGEQLVVRQRQCPTWPRSLLRQLLEPSQPCEPMTSSNLITPQRLYLQMLLTWTWELNFQYMIFERTLKEQHPSSSMSPLMRGSVCPSQCLWTSSLHRFIVHLLPEDVQAAQVPAPASS